MSLPDPVPRAAAAMTGEKIRSLRRDHKPSKEDGDVLEPCEEEATAALGGAFTGGRSGAGGSGKGGKACHKIFSHHHRLQLKAPAAPGPGVPAPPQHNAVTATCPAPACLGSNPVVVADGGSCPSLYPVHECVFKGDVRRLSSLIRTHNIGQKDNHGELLWLCPISVHWGLGGDRRPWVPGSCSRTVFSSGRKHPQSFRCPVSGVRSFESYRCRKDVFFLST